MTCLGGPYHSERGGDGFQVKSRGSTRYQHEVRKRAGRLAMPFWTTATAKKQLRLLAAEEETTQQALLTKALNALFRSRGKPPVA
jgi:hypothetical protein